MRASLRPQKRDHISAFNTRTNRKVLHLRKCAEALLKELENKKSDETNEDVNNNDDDFSKRRTKVKFLAAEVALKAIRRAREGDLPRKLIDQQNYCLRCGFPLHKEEDQKKKSNTNENNNNDDSNRRMNCSCCGYKVSSSIHAKKKKKKKKTKKRRIL
jgi:ribosomal protein L37E